MQFRDSKVTSVATLHAGLTTSELNFPKQLQTHLSNNPDEEKCEGNKPTILSFNRKQIEPSI